MENEIILKKGKRELQLRKAEEFINVTRQVRPKSWKGTLYYDEEKFWGEIERRFGLLYSFLSWNPCFLCCSFIVEPILNKYSKLEGIVIRPSDEDEKDYISGYNMAIKFAKRFEEKYLTKYSVTIKPRKYS